MFKYIKKKNQFSSSVIYPQKQESVPKSKSSRSILSVTISSKSISIVSVSKKLYNKGQTSCSFVQIQRSVYSKFNQLSNSCISKIIFKAEESINQINENKSFLILFKGTQRVQHFRNNLFLIYFYFLQYVVIKIICCSSSKTLTQLQGIHLVFITCDQRKNMEPPKQEKVVTDDYITNLQQAIDSSRDRQDAVLEKRYQQLFTALERAKNNYMRYSQSLQNLKDSIDKSSQIQKVLEDVTAYKNYSTSLHQDVQNITETIESLQKKCRNIRKVIEIKHQALGEQNAKNLSLLRAITQVRNGIKKVKLESQKNLRINQKLSQSHSQHIIHEDVDIQQEINQAKRENENLRSQLNQQKNNKYIKAELFTDCMNAFKKNFEQSQKVVTKQGLQNSFLFQIKKASLFMTESDHKTKHSKSLLSQRQVRSLIHDTLKNMVQEKEQKLGYLQVIQCETNLDVNVSQTIDFSKIDQLFFITYMQKMIQIGNYIYEDKNVGGGQFSQVYIGFDQNTMEQVAVKVIDFTKVKDPIISVLINNEISVLDILKTCQNILKLYAVFKDSKQIYIVTEYCDQGDLQNLLKISRIPIQQTVLIIQQILNGVYELKKNAVIHRDIKSANIFLKQGIPKLADFGFAICKNISFAEELTYYNVGTPIYMPPETLMQNKYSMKSDIWATGIVLYELLFNSYPFVSNSEPLLIQRYLQYQQRGDLEYPFQIPMFFDQLLRGMLEFDKEKRWSVEQCLQYIEDSQNRQLPFHIQQRSPVSLTKFSTPSASRNNSYYEIKTTSPTRQSSVITENTQKSTQISQSILEQRSHDGSQAFGLFLLKILRLLQKAPSFEILLENQFYSLQDVFAMQNKLQFCILQTCIFIFSEVNTRLTAECQSALKDVKERVYHQFNYYVKDIGFIQLLNKYSSFDELTEPLQAYIQQNLHLTNELFLNSIECSEPNLIILLDYLLILQRLLQIFHQLNKDWIQFNLKTNIDVLIKQPINTNINRKHWEKIYQRLKSY
ncbi:hypothetical protein pb186bvf_019572 [Paramecium bursaria]